MPQEWFLGGQGTITNLRGSLASTLAFKAAGAIGTEGWQGTGECRHPFGGDEVSKGFFEQISQNGIRMVARAQVAEWVDSVIGAIAACRAIAESQMREETRIYQARLDWDGAGNGNAKFHRGGLRHCQRPANLFGGGQQFFELRLSASAWVEAVEHDAACPEGERQPDGFI